MDAGKRAGLQERVRRDWGLELPESIFRFWDFAGSLGPAQALALGELGVSGMGLSDLVGEPDRPPREGVDVRVHGRYYRDPPEFVTFMHGGSDGLHYGLWFDDGRSCDGVASYYTNDGGAIVKKARTPLEAVREILEQCQRDYDYDPDHYSDEQLSGVNLVRQALMAFETGDRPETGTAYLNAYEPPVYPPEDFERITTLDGAGALVTGATALDRPPHNGADEGKFSTYMHDLFKDPVAVEESVAEARRRLAAGDPAEVLVLGRDLHWASWGNPVHEAYAAELLQLAYQALGRTSLAEIASAHHRHRDLKSVNVLP